MAQSVYARFGSTALTGVNQVIRQHTVLAGDTIPKIAAFWEKTLGYSSEYWRQICSTNGITDLDALTTGTVLVIPSPLPTST